jgi:alkane 1-monooxygenase
MAVTAQAPLHSTLRPTGRDAAEPTLSARRSFGLHLWAFFLPLLTTTYLVFGPYQWWAALLWIVPIFVLVLFDVKAPPDFRQPDEGTPSWPFDVQVYALTALQIFNHVLLGVMASKLTLASWADAGVLLANLAGMHAVAGVTAGYSGIVVAHELVHRKNRFQFFLGRLLLMFVWYEHFATEHVRGHHPRLGTRDDPATARFGETFREFLWRTVPAQWKSAYELECIRLGDEHMKLWDPRMLRHRVLQGLLAQVAITAGYFVVFGWIAALFFVLQARMAILLLEVVNYIEHWGITRAGRAVTTVDSWDTDNWFTLYTLVGLSRHSDHHARASRHYQMLRRFDESPKMPSGYYGTILMALIQNQRYRDLAAAELRRKGLGPFRAQAGSMAETVNASDTAALAAGT